MALPRPRATLTGLSAGALRAFLLADCCVNEDVVEENKTKAHRYEHFAAHKQIGAPKKQTQRHLPGPVSPAGLSSSCLSSPCRPSHSCSCSSPPRPSPPTRWTSPWETREGFASCSRKLFNLEWKCCHRFNSLQHGKLRGDHPAVVRCVVRREVLSTWFGEVRGRCGPKIKTQVAGVRVRAGGWEPRSRVEEGEEEVGRTGSRMDRFELSGT